jgi:fructuronate reductase
VEAGGDPVSDERPRLSDRTLDRLAGSIRRPAYDRTAVRTAVVHFGPGAFHRAHQAFFFDRMLADHPGFGVCAVSLRSDEVRAALAPQDGLYSLFERGPNPTIRIVGALKTVLTAPRTPDLVFAALTDPGVRMVTATVSEKGSCLTPAGDLDLDAPEIRRDQARRRRRRAWSDGWRRDLSAGARPGPRRSP